MITSLMLSTSRRGTLRLLKAGWLHKPSIAMKAASGHPRVCAAERGDIDAVAREVAVARPVPTRPSASLERPPAHASKPPSSARPAEYGVAKSSAKPNGWKWHPGAMRKCSASAAPGPSISARRAGSCGARAASAKISANASRESPLGRRRSEGWFDGEAAQRERGPTAIRWRTTSRPARRPHSFQRTAIADSA
jgi:hypothetical protein